MTQHHDCTYLEDLKFVQSQYNTLCYFLESLKIQIVDDIIDYVNNDPSDAIKNAEEQLFMEQCHNESCKVFEDPIEEYGETTRKLDFSQESIYDDMPPLESVDESKPESTFDHNIFEPFSKEFIDIVYEFAQSNLKFALNQYDSKTKSHYNIDAREFPKIYVINISTGVKTEFEWCQHKFGPYLNVPRLYVKYWDGTKFVKYDDDSSFEILRAKTFDAKKITIMILDVDYEINLVNMTQKNIKTGFKRNIVIETH